MSPTYGGWGGRYVWRQPTANRGRPGRRAAIRIPGRDNSRDTVIGVDGQTVHVRSGDDLAMADGVPARLRRAHGLDDQGDRAQANHNPEVVVNGSRGQGARASWTRPSARR